MAERTLDTNEPQDAPRPGFRGPRRWLYVFVGFCFTFLAILGVLLPVLPSTPFVLLASYFFVRSSPRLNERLLRSRLFGPMLRDWQLHRGVRLRVKLLVLVLIPLMVTISIVLGELSLWLAILVIVLGLIGLGVVLRLPLVRDRTVPLPASLQADAQSVTAPKSLKSLP
jgi:uncharacterized membrane protein YbaN (DUF454 family)